MKKRILLMLLAATVCGCQSTVPSGSTDSAAAGHRRPGKRAEPDSDALDSRIQVPLLPRMAQHQRENMRDHLTAVQEILGAVAQNDFSGVEKAAARIESSNEMQQMCSHMGRGAPGFTELALNFHRTADSIGAAARKEDRSGVLQALSNTLATCVGCHATYRQLIVDENTWRHLTGQNL